jgi:2,5-dihydroxypyridine 5,6-dioxygenase
MADFVIDMTSVGLLHTKEQVAVLEAGTRMLMVHDPVEALERMFPTDEDKERIQRHGQRLREAKRVRVQSDNGTEVWFDKTDRPVIEQWGWTDEPGRWDHWPGAFAYTAPTEGMGEGVIVLDPGDIWYPPKSYLTTPVKMTFENGAAVKIEGTSDARMIREYIEGWQDPEGYMISHIGFGGHRRGLWNAVLFQDPLDIIGQDGRTAWGTTLFALGSNVTFGGTHTTGCHQDFALKQQRFFLDDELVADSGKVIPDYLQ